MGEVGSSERQSSATESEGEEEERDTLTHDYLMDLVDRIHKTMQSCHQVKPAAISVPIKADIPAGPISANLSATTC